MHSFLIPHLSFLNSVARQVLDYCGESSVFAFYGEMGVGKTTFIKALCEELGVDFSNSPSFSIVNEYVAKDGKCVYHFDFYRLNSSEEIFDIGYEEYIDSGNKCFMEWAEKMEQYLPDNCVKIYLQELPDGSREIKIVNRLSL